MTPVPDSVTVVVLPEAALLLRVSAPVELPADVGLNVTCNATVWPGLSVIGNVAPVNENPVPVMDAELIVSAAPPFEAMVTVCELGLAIVILPKARLVGLTASCAVPAFSWSETVLLIPPAEAVKVTVWAVVTVDAVAVNVAVEAPAATVTDAGTVTELLLLASATANPPVPAAAVRETEQLSVTAPVNELLLQLTLLNCPLFLDCP